MALSVNRQRNRDWPEIWDVLRPAFRAGDSYPLSRNVSEADARRYWIKQDGYNGVARGADGAVTGVYYLRPDQGGPGGHVCNAGYVIADHARGRGLASALCIESQERARAMEYRAMVFNLVVATNEAAIRAWLKAGMTIIGTKPRAFQLPDGTFADAHVMWKAL